MFANALILGILSGLGRIDSSVIQIYWHRPIVMGLIVGFVLGDVQTGLLAGAMLELTWMGLVPLAGAQPPDPIVGGILGVAFAILTKQPPETAVAFAVPFAIAAQAMKTALYNVWIAVAHKADQYAEAGEDKMIGAIQFGSLALHFLAYGTIVFLPLYLGAEAANSIVALIPQKFMNGLAIAGKIMPAVGLATLLKIMLKKEYVPFLIVGFIFSVYLKLPVMAVAIIGIAFALWEIVSSNKAAKGGEFSDGI